MSAPGQPGEATASGQAAEIERLTRELAQVRAEFQDFVYTVSHDLRAPLRHINAFAQVVQEDLPDAPPDIRQHLATIRQSAQLLTQQMDGLATLSRLEQQRLQLQAVDVVPLVQSVADELMQQHPGRQVVWQLAQDVPPVRADPDALRQVFTHLVGNALKFSRGRTPAQITLSWLVALEAPGVCQISLDDNGAGFAREQAGKLFTVFGRLHLARDFAGLGLGLVTSRKLLERMGGGVTIAAQVNAGCRVIVQLPLAECY